MKGTHIVRRRTNARRNTPYKKIVAGLSKYQKATGLRLPRVATHVNGTTHLRTKTSTGLFQKVLHRDGPISDSFFRYPSRHHMKIGKTLKALTGEQFMTCNDILRLSSAVNDQAIGTIPSGYFDGLAIGNILGLAANVVATSGTNLNFKVLLEECQAKCLFTNQTNDVVRMTLYDILPRRDINNGSYTPPSAAWVTGDAATAGGASAYTYAGSTPFQTPAFTKLWEVVKVTNVDLHTGGHHVHNIMYKPKCMMDKQTFTENGGSANIAYKNLTGFTMVVIHGLPVNGTSGTNISLAATAIDCAVVRQYKFRVFESSVSQIAQITTNFQAPVGGQNLFNDLTAAATTVTTL